MLLAAILRKVTPLLRVHHLKKTIKPNTLHGSSIIRHKRKINIVGFDLEFLGIDELTDVDIIIGEVSPTFHSYPTSRN